MDASCGCVRYDCGRSFGVRSARYLMVMILYFLCTTSLESSSITRHLGCFRRTRCSAVRRLHWEHEPVPNVLDKIALLFAIPFKSQSVFRTTWQCWWLCVDRPRLLRLFTEVVRSGAILNTIFLELEVCVWRLLAIPRKDWGDGAVQ